MAEARIATLTMKSDRPTTVARFWRDLLGYEVAPNHSDSIMLVAPGQPALLIQPSQHPVPSGAVHLDLRPADQARCVETALRLGATHADVGQTGDEGWVVLADPGGNLFCVLPSDDEHQALLARDPGAPTPID
jgi:hypothetical protein